MPARPSAARATGRPSLAAAARLDGAVLDAAQALFLSRGYAGTSMEAVAARAGVSKRTLYARHAGKPELFRAVVGRLVTGWLPGFDARLDPSGGLEAALVGAAERILAVALAPEALALHQLVVAEGGRFPELAGLLHEAGADAGHAGIASLLLRASPGTIGTPAGASIGTEEAGFAAEQFMHLVLAGPQRRALGLGAPPDPARWARRAVALFLYGWQGAAASSPA